MSLKHHLPEKIVYVCIYIWIEILLHSILDFSMFQNHPNSWHTVNLSANKLNFSPCFLKIFTMSTKLSLDIFFKFGV